VDANACDGAIVDDTTNGLSITHSSWETVDESEIDEKVIPKRFTIFIWAVNALSD